MHVRQGAHRSEPVGDDEPLGDQCVGILDLGNGAEVHFPDRQGRQSLVAQHADVKFPAFDVLLDQCIALYVLVDKLDALSKLCHVPDDRRLRDAE